MNTPNSHIEEFLNYYYSLEKDPGYAVLLKGKWGTGKTWFIKKTLDSFAQKNGKYLYVSLYGMTSFKEIEAEFFRQLHPVLSSKKMQLVGKIAKGALKATIKVDLDSDGKADGTLSPQIPELNLPEYLTNTSEFVIVFDDLERASIKLENLLGYINHYVEHQNYKVVIVANEEEIIKLQDGKDNFRFAYKTTKEKLIGKTFEVASDFSGALSFFISEIKKDFARTLYNKNIELISELHKSSQYHNLRHLKQALWDFERFLSFVSETSRLKDGLPDHLLKIFLILSFELKSGNLLPEDISSFKADFLLAALDSNDNKKESHYKRMTQKYKNVNFGNLLIEESIWIDFFDKSFCSEERIQESLEKSEYFRTENTPDWIKLWHLMDLSDDEFSTTFESVEKNFHEMKYDELGVIIHITGIFLLLSKLGLINKTKSDVVKSSCSYIDFLKKNNSTTLKTPNINGFINGAWGGLGFHEKESDEFKELNRYIDKISKQVIIESYPTAGDELIDLINKNADLFYRKVGTFNDSNNIYYNTPILQYVNKIKFVEAFTRAVPKSKNMICYAFSERYQYENINQFLLSELNWLRDVVNLLKEKQELSAGKISGYQLQSYIKHYFMPAIETLERSAAKKNSQPTDFSSD